MKSVKVMGIKVANVSFDVVGTYIMLDIHLPILLVRIKVTSLRYLYCLMK